MKMEANDEIPKEFRQIAKDFLSDLFTTFPEYRADANQMLVSIVETDDSPIEPLFEHVKKVFPERFFDILYKNTDMFADADKSTEFLPGIDFAEIWKMDDISDSTRDTIWRYLQLLMFSILSKIQDQTSFGDTAKMFETINEDELKVKIEETMEQMKNVFESAGTTPGEGINLDDLPNADSVHEHLNGLMGGKLGKLAAEIAEETAKDFDMDLNGEGDVNDMFKKMFQNPGKLMGLVNTISTKLDSKMKSGDINETDLMKEATDMMTKMNSMPGMPNIQDLMKNMNMPNGQSGMMKQHLNQNMRTSGTKARLQRKLEEKQAAAKQLQEIAKKQESTAQQAATTAQQAATTAQQAATTAEVAAEAANNMVFDGKSFSDGSTVKRSKAKQGKKGKKK